MANRFDDSTREEDLAVLLQRYLDGELAGPEATKLFLAAESDPVLAHEIDAYRSLFSELDAMPIEEPSRAFDARVLATVPYQKYASAPRKELPVLVFGKELPSPISRVLRSMGTGMTAVAAAYLLFLVVSHSFLADFATSAASAAGAALHSLADSASETPLLSDLVGSLAWAYDGVVASVGALGRAWGEGPVTLLLGLALGALLVAAVHATRRRQGAKRTHA